MSTTCRLALGFRFDSAWGDDALAEIFGFPAEATRPHVRRRHAAVLLP